MSQPPWANMTAYATYPRNPSIWTSPPPLLDEDPHPPPRREFARAAEDVQAPVHLVPALHKERSRPVENGAEIS